MLPLSLALCIIARNMECTMIEECLFFALQHVILEELDYREDLGEW